MSPERRYCEGCCLFLAAPGAGGAVDFIVNFFFKKKKKKMKVFTRRCLLGATPCAGGVVEGFKRQCSGRVYKMLFIRRALEVHCEGVIRRALCEGVIRRALEVIVKDVVYSEQRRALDVR